MRHYPLILVAFISLFLAASVPNALAAEDYSEALALYEKGDFSSAVTYLRDYVAQKPEASAYYLLGYALYKLGKFNEASEYFKQTYLIDPDFSPQQMDYFKKQPPAEVRVIEQLSGRAGSEEPQGETPPPAEGQPAPQQSAEEAK
ncbi:MAG: tetratricopeptide repeat protein [Thermodesulfovibrionales bacterium]